MIYHPISTLKSVACNQGGDEFAQNVATSEVTHSADVRLLRQDQVIVEASHDELEGEAERKVWKVQVKEGGDSQQWWEMQDLYVNKVNADLLSTKESYIMVWEKRKTKGKSKAA